MPSKASKSPARPERERLLPPAFVLTFTAMVGIGLALMFPRETLRERLLGEGRAVDGLSMAYLEAWWRASPDDSGFMAVLAEQYARTGRLDEAESMLGRLEARYNAARQGPVRNPADADLPGQVLRTRIEIMQQRAFAAQPDTPERKLYVDRLAGLLDQAVPMPWSRGDLEDLATTARAVNALKPAQAFYRALAKSDPARAELWNAQAASAALAGGDYQQAAEALFSAQARATDPAEQRRLFLAGLKTLQSGNLLDQALAQAEQRGGKLLDNAEVLRYLTRLALAANRPEQAARYVERLLRQPPSVQGLPAAPRAELRRAEVRRIAAAQPWAAQGVVFLDGPRGLALRRAMGEDGMPHLRRVADTPGAAAASAPAAAPAAAAATDPAAADRAFNADDYELAFQVFLSAGKLNDAQRVAETAVKRLPGSARWRERLAQVAEWNRQPAVALQSWLEYAQASNDEAAWKAVLRLAPALNDDRAYLAALRHRAGNGNLATIDEVVATYERLGEPEDAMAFLQGLSQGPNARPAMERQAELAERAGKDARAFELYTALQTRFGPRPQYALKQANLLYVRGALREALQAMVPSMKKAGPADIEFWRTLTELARLNQRDDLLEQGYRQLMLAMAETHDDHCLKMPPGAGRNDCLAEVRDTEESDFSNLIDFYDSSPIDAGRIAEAGWRKGGKLESLELAINYYTRARAYGRVASLLQAMTPAQLRQAEQASRFLAMRAEYLRARGERERALADLRRAAALPDAGSETLAALMWSLVDLGSDTEVRAMMQRLQGEAEGNPDLWGAFAAGSMRFQDGRGSLHYLRKMASGKSADPLWLGLAADAYDAIGQTDTGWRLRRQAWIDLHSDKTPEGRRASDPRAFGPAAEEEDEQGGPAPAELQRQTVALGQIFASGDVSRRLVMEMLRADRTVMAGSRAADWTGPVAPKSRLGEIPGLPPLALKLPQDMAQREARQQAVVSAAAREVALAWALSNESNALARAWLARQYARQLLRPAYAEVTLALAGGDLNALDRVLERQAGRVPVDNQIEANMQLDRLGAAQTQAFETQDVARTDDSLQETVQESLLFNAQAIEPRVTYQRQSPLAYFNYSLAGGVRLWDGYDLNLRGVWRSQHSTDQTQLTGVPGSDQRGELSLGYRDQHKRWRLAVGRRDGLDSMTTARFTGEWREDSRLSFTTEAGLNQSADESAALRVGGAKDVLGLGATWNFSLREFAGARVEYNRFRGQDGSSLGNGMVYDFELGYRIRTAYPDYTVRLVGTHARYNTRSGTLSGKLATLVPTDDEATPAFYMPQGFTQAGVTFGFGTELLDDYTHKWRPFAELGLLHDTRAGQNFRAQLGIAGTVLGNDHLSMYLQHETAARNGGTPLTEVGVRYKWLF